MGRASITHGEKAECMQNFGGKDKRKDTTRKTFVGGRIILKLILEK
jgi:hypothetical protein